MAASTTHPFELPFHIMRVVGKIEYKWRALSASRKDTQRFPDRWSSGPLESTRAECEPHARSESYELRNGAWMALTCKTSANIAGRSCALMPRLSLRVRVRVRVSW